MSHVFAPTALWQAGNLSSGWNSAVALERRFRRDGVLGQSSMHSSITPVLLPDAGDRCADERDRSVAGQQLDGLKPWQRSGRYRCRKTVPL
jgi:hypothetical protein